MSIDTQHETLQLLQQLGVPDDLPGIACGNDWLAGQGDLLKVTSPIDGRVIAEFNQATAEQLDLSIEQAKVAFKDWRCCPAPVRGQVVHAMGQQLRTHKEPLAKLVTLENGKIFQEALGEVQEMIDICDFAVGLSRQLYGLTIATERPSHRLMEQWHPLGPVGVISAFNFPVAVWSWNTMLALVCGDPVVWKPSEKTPLTALACHAIAMQALKEFPDISPGILQTVVGGRELGAALAADSRLPLISATGSTAMGKSVAQVVAARLGRQLLELGGNNAAIVTPSADLDLAIRAMVFSAVGTCGQRCTTLRRIIAHEDQYQQVKDRMLAAYDQLAIGNPLDSKTLIGPLIDRAAQDQMRETLEQAKAAGGTVHGGEDYEAGLGGCYVRPALVEIDASAEIAQTETFAPITYLIRYSGSLEDAIEMQNSVPQGLSSSIFTDRVQDAETFYGPAGSDCGIANVNIGTSGAEIGGAFGGEKETGGGRESGSDAWKAYMRRATNTVNYSSQLPLAQGIKFDF